MSPDLGKCGERLTPVELVPEPLEFVAQRTLGQSGEVSHALTPEHHARYAQFLEEIGGNVEGGFAAAHVASMLARTAQLRHARRFSA